MKQILKYGFGLLASVLCMTTFQSCSDDDAPWINEPTEEESEIVAPATADYATINVKASGNWTVEKEDNENSDWLFVINDSGNGNGTIQVSLDPNYEGIDRSADLYVTNGKERVKYTVRQYSVESNGAEDMNYANTRLGHGIKMTITDDRSGSDISTYTTAGSVFKISDLYKNRDDYEYVEVSELSSSALSITTLDEATVSKRQITANLSVDVAYGVFKLGLKGDFKMFGEEMDSTKTFAAVAQYPRYLVEVNYDDMAWDLIRDKDLSDPEIKAAASKVFSSSFLNKYAKIEALVAKKINNSDAYTSKDESDLQKQISALDNAYGAAFASSATTGGMATIDMKFSTQHAIDTLQIKGKLTTTISSLFKLNVEASAEYLNATRSDVSGSTLSVKVNGGRLSEMNNVMNALMKLNAGDITATAITEPLEAWGQTLDESPTTFMVTFSPIWELFSDDAAEEVMKYYLKKYPKDKTYMFDVHVAAGE